MWKLVMKLGHVKALLALSSAKQYQRFKVRSWPKTDLAVKANEDRFELGSGHQCTGSAMPIYEFTP